MVNTIRFHVASDILGLRTFIANVYFIGKKGAKSGEWVLVDGGISLGASRILRTARERFGKKSRPKAIILTHGHFDHVGALSALVKEWKVPIYAHELEIPYLTEKKDYFPPDPSVGGGLMSLLSPFFPRRAVNLSDHIKPLPREGSIPFLHEWRYIHTPGHTEGHLSLFREYDRILLPGDAFITVKQESFWAVLSQSKQVHGPPAYFTTDWDKARESVKRLASLHPAIAAPGHGLPMSGAELKNQLNDLAEYFNELAVPEQGRYVH
ncbi:MBL fold metallo-hydrolase [Bacillus songklensis]|uniref:MBL fold metallo-hydrolase n=1 Tax=Bacillus songklensis TaxID=1069116 RepID=A0ABV8B6X9_9BACI